MSTKKEMSNMNYHLLLHEKYRARELSPFQNLTINLLYRLLNLLFFLSNLKK